MRNNFAISEAISVLERTPEVFRALLAGLPEPWILADEGPETFSAFENLGHLVHGERTDWIPRARIILAQSGDRAFEPYDRFAQKRESAGKSLAVLLDEFTVLRRRNLATLRSWDLDDHQLALTGVHPAFGEVTLAQLLATWVVHDLGHIAQTSRVLAKRYLADVGPWVEYLPVLRPKGDT